MKRTTGKAPLFPSDVDGAEFSADLIKAFKAASQTGDLKPWQSVTGKMTMHASTPFYVVDALLARPLFSALASIRRLETRLAAVEGNGIKFMGAYEPGKLYRRGAVIVRKGSSWIALQDTGDDPGQPTPSKAWALMAQKGRDAR
jgi:hypothetical protein